MIISIRLLYQYLITSYVSMYCKSLHSAENYPKENLFRIALCKYISYLVNPHNPIPKILAHCGFYSVGFA